MLVFGLGRPPTSPHMKQRRLFGLPSSAVCPFFWGIGSQKCLQKLMQHFHQWNHLNNLRLWEQSHCHFPVFFYMGVSQKMGTPKSWILTGFSINHPFWGVSPSSPLSKGPTSSQLSLGAAGHREWPCVTNATALAKAYNLEEAYWMTPELDETAELGWCQPRKFGGNLFWSKKRGAEIFEELKQGLFFL